MSDNWRPNASRPTLERRARMLGDVRNFFAARGVLEVETPILSAAAGTDPSIEPLSTHLAVKSRLFWLQTSPEFAMKRLLAAGSGDVYQVCKVFRDDESGRWHNPEFTMLEWYRQGFDDFALMDELETLIGALLAPERRLPAAERLSYAEALRRHAGVDAFLATDAELAAAAARHGHRPASDLDRDARLDLLMGFVVGPKLGRVQPTFICDYPASQASLARLKPRASPHAPQVAARFELYIDGLELANGFHELANANEQRERFGADLVARVARDQQLPAMDENLLAALDAGLPDCAGVALGLDRVLALATGANSLADVVSFDINRA